MVPLPNVSTSVASRSGDSSASQTTPFQYNAPFAVGGSGSQTQSSGAQSLDSGGIGSNLPLYIGLGIAGIVALGFLLNARRS